MEIRNYENGVRVTAPLPNVILNKFYWKNLARIAWDTGVGFSIYDPTEYQGRVTFNRDEVTAIYNNDGPVPLPVTDDELFRLLCTYFYSPLLGHIDPSKTVVAIFGPTFLGNEGDNGKVFTCSTPDPNKIYTFPPGLSKGWNAEFIKLYVGGGISFVGGVGMSVLGIDTILSNQFAKMQIVYTSPTVAICSNIGG
jgi:hypothetical protein